MIRLAFSEQNICRILILAWRGSCLEKARTCRFATILEKHRLTLLLRLVLNCFFFFLSFFYLFFTYILIKDNFYDDYLTIVRLLILHGGIPLDVDENGVSALDLAKLIAKEREESNEEQATAILEEIESYLENPIRYRSDCSALIALSIGLASLDLPVLIVTLISEYLVSINEEKLFGQYPEHKNWKIASLIKKKSKEN